MSRATQAAPTTAPVSSRIGDTESDTSIITKTRTAFTQVAPCFQLDEAMSHVDAGEDCRPRRVRVPHDAASLSTGGTRRPVRANGFLETAY